MPQINAQSNNTCAISNKQMQNGSSLNYQLYSNTQYGISMECPNRWVINESIDPGNIVVFYAPQDNNSNSSKAVLGIYIQDFTFLNNTNMTLDSYSNILLNTLQNQSVNITKSSYTNIDKNQAYEVVFKDNEGFKVYYAWTIKNNKAYVILFIATDQEYTKYLNYINGIVNSLRIK